MSNVQRPGEWANGGNALSLLCSESLLQVINEMLSQLAKRKLDAIIDEACDAQFKLEFKPATTTELASSLLFLDEIQKRVRRTLHVNSNSIAFMFSTNWHLSPCVPFPILVFVLYACCVTCFLYFWSDHGARAGAGNSESDVQSD